MPLFEHQPVIRDHHLKGPCTGDLSDVGVGKTAPMVVALQWLKDQRRISRILVVCPSSIIENWQREIEKWSDLVAVPLRGERKKRIDALAKPADIHIVNYESTWRLQSHLEKIGFDAMICDEVHHAKTFNVKQTKAILALSRTLPVRKVMTGTVLTNNLLDVWSICEIVSPKILGINYWGFRNKYMMATFDIRRDAWGRIKQEFGHILAQEGKDGLIRFFMKMSPWARSKYIFGTWAPKPGAAEEIKRFMAPWFIRFEKREVNKFLPPVLFEKRTVEMAAEQRKVYNDLKRHFIAELQDGTVLVVRHILSRIGKLLQIANGFTYRENPLTPYFFKDNPKLKELKAMVDELGGNRLVIWAAFREEIKMLLDVLPGSEGIWGDVKETARLAIVDRFNADEIPYLVCNAQTAGEGLNIFTPYAIWYSRTWNLGNYQQSLGRHDRPGAEQFDNLTMINLVTEGTVDARVFESLSMKRDLQASVTPDSWRRMLKEESE